MDFNFDATIKMENECQLENPLEDIKLQISANENIDIKLEQMTSLDIEPEEPQANVKSEIPDIKLEEEELTIKLEEDEEMGIDHHMAETKLTRLNMVLNEESTKVIQFSCKFGNHEKHQQKYQWKDKMFKCIVCNFESKHYRKVKQHIIQVHGDPSQVKLLKCNECSYQCKDNSNLVRHKLVHKDPSEVTMFKCNECSFQSKHPWNVKQHIILKHKDASEVEMFNCNECSYQSRRKGHLEVHKLVHKDPSQLKMFKCNECSYQTKKKGPLKRHELVHKDPAQLTMFKCNECSYDSKDKRNLKLHINRVHKDRN